MNILKVYDTLSIMSCEMRELVFANPDSKLLHTENIVELYNGAKVYFRIVRDMKDARKLDGVCFQCIDTSAWPYIERDVLQYLQTRIRG